MYNVSREYYEMHWSLILSQLHYDFTLILLLTPEPSPLSTTATVMDSTASPPTSEEKGCDNDGGDGGVEGEEEDNHSLVEVYADRLCAVTHAFALCCATLQKNSGR